MKPMGSLDHETAFGAPTNVVLVQVRQDHFEEVLEVGRAVLGLDVVFERYCAAHSEVSVHVFP